MYKNDIYLREVLSNTPRILGNLCRVPSFVSYGCFDRQYWNYAAYPMPLTRKQEAVLTLALLYAIDVPQNPYFKNRQTLEFIKAGIEYWSTLQLSSGAFNDLYPNEHAHVSTAFTGYAVSETFLTLKDDWTPEAKYANILKKAAIWLRKYHDPLVVNHDAGVVPLFYNMFLLTGNDEYKSMASERLKFLASKQDDEGWFPEYGGPDIGYLSLTISYLAKYYQKSKDAEALKILDKAVGFISYFIHPDGSSGGEYASRNTEYLLPDGFEILSSYIPMAGAIAEVLRKSLNDKKTIGLSELDDKFLLFNGYNYLQAYLYGSENIKTSAHLPCISETRKHFVSSGFFVKSTPSYYYVINTKKGGNLYMYLKAPRVAIRDAGILVLAKNKSNLVSGYLADDAGCVEGNKVYIRTKLAYAFDNRMSETKNILFRGFQITFGNIIPLSIFVKSLLRKMIISRRRISEVKFERTFDSENDYIIITDRLVVPADAGLLTYAPCLDTIYGECARYYSSDRTKDEYFNFSLEGEQGKSVEIKREFNIAGGNVGRKITFI